MKIQFSIIVPVYNVEQYLEKCIVSVINQTYKNYELLLINDGSTDSCPEIINNFASKFNYIKAIHKENGGLGDARNVGLDHANGDYIVFVDSDDWIEDNYLSDVSQIILKTNAEIIRCGWFEENGAHQIKVNEYQDQVLNKKKFMNELLLDSVGSQVWKNVYKKNLWDGIRFPKCLYEDLYTTHLVVDKADIVYSTKNAYYHYLIRVGNISTTFKPEKAKDIFYGFLSRYEFMKINEFNENEIKYISNKLCKNALQAIHGLSILHMKKDIKEIVALILLISRNDKIRFLNYLELAVAKNWTEIYMCMIRWYYRLRHKGI